MRLDSCKCHGGFDRPRRAITGAALSRLTIAVVSIAMIALAPRPSAAGTSDAPAISQDLVNADKLYRAGDYDRAITLLEQVEARARALGNVEGDRNYATTIDVLANAYAAKGRYLEAEPLYKHALAIREKLLGPDSPDVAASLNDLGELYRVQGRNAEAEPLYKRAIAILEKAVGPEHPVVAQCLNNLAILYANEGRFADAEPLHKRALAIREKAFGPGDAAVAASLLNLGEVYRLWGSYDHAEPLYKQAEAIFEKTLGPEHPYVATCLNNLALLYGREGRFAEAEPLQRRALAIRKKVLGAGHPEVAEALNNLGELYRDQGRYAEAELLGQRVLAIRQKALGPDHPDVAASLNNLAEVYRREHRDADAEPLYKQAVAVLEKAVAPDSPDLAATLNNLAITYVDQGRLAEAEPLHKRSLAIKEKSLGPDHPDVGMSLGNLALLYQEQGRYSEAEPLAKRALSIYEKALGPNHLDVGRALNNLAALYDLEGRFADALPLVRTATERGYVLRRIHLATLKGAYAAGSVAEADAVTESFSVVQQASSSAASAALGQLAVRFAAGSGDLASLVRREQDYAAADDRLDEAVIAEISKAPNERNHDREQALRAELEKTSGALRGVRAELGTRFPDYVALSKPQAIGLTDAQALLGEDEALVVIDLATPSSPDDDDDYLWIVTRDNAGWGKLATRKGEIADEVATLRAELDPHSDKAFDANLAYRLYQQTFGRAESVIAGKHQLLVVPSGALTSLPPQVLVTADPAGKTLKSYDWLLRHYAVTVLPSVASLKILASTSARSAAKKPMAGYGDPVFNKENEDKAGGSNGGTRPAAVRGYGSYYRGGLVADVETLRRGLQALPETAAELQSVARTVGADPADIKLGSAATVTAVKQARLDQYRLIYFATHALVAGEVAQFAKIDAEPALALSLPDQPTLADDGLLKASEVAELKLDADIVVLSACNTAAGDQPGAEALSGLARAFFYAGARALIVSHWPVDSDATVKLMTATFSAMAADQSLTPSQALRKSMLSLIDDPKHPDAANPTFWGPFVVVGGARSAH